MAAEFIFNDLLPRGGEFKVRALDFISRGVQLYEYQRQEAAERVKQIVDEQLQHGKLLFATAFVLVHVNGVHKLCDGQHRLAALKQLCFHPDMFTLEIRVIVHLCGEDQNLAERIYLQCNNQYMINGAIDRTTNQLFKRDTLAMSRRVVEEIKRYYPGQIGSRFPNFDTNALESELNTSKILDRKSVEEVVALIIRENGIYGPILAVAHAGNYFRCKEKGGFFLPAKEAGCRWIREIAQKY